jgi:hypothetical protein
MVRKCGRQVDTGQIEEEQGIYWHALSIHLPPHDFFADSPDASINFLVDMVEERIRGSSMASAIYSRGDNGLHAG